MEIITQIFQKITDLFIGQRMGQTHRSAHTIPPVFAIQYATYTHAYFASPKNAK